MNYEILEFISGPSLVIDAGNRIVFANQEAIKLFNLPDNYRMEKTEILFKDSYWFSAALSGRPSMEKFSVAAEDGNSNLWNITASPASADDAKPDIIITFYNTGKMKESIIGQALDKWWGALSSHLSSRIIYSLDTDLCSLEFAGDVTTLTGYSLEELASLGVSGFLDLVHPDDRRLAESKTNMVLSSISDVCLEYRFKRKDGHFIYISDTCALVTDLGEKPFRFVGTIKEITQRKMELENLSRGLDKARESERAKTRFLAMISHEMRTPLHSIRGIAGMLDDESTDGKKTRMIRLMKKSCDVLDRLVEDASDIALIEEGRMRIRNENVSILDLILYISEIYAAQFAEKGIAFGISRDAGVPDYITGDSNRIIQIFINLIGNALKFTARGSVFIRIRTDHDRSRILFEFEDTGPGIESKALNDIFIPFNEAANAGLKHIKGTGLGLAISKRLALLMDGDITVESRIGQGSRFVLHLPIENALSAGSGKSFHLNDLPVLPSISILAVDDIPENIELLKLFFSDTGIRLIEAFNGKDAVSLFKTECPDCVLMDMYLPDINGQVAVKLIREHERTSGKNRIPVIGITADCTSEHISQAIEAGCDICLTRPVGKAELFDHIAGFFTKDVEPAAPHAKEPDETADMKPKAIERIMKIASDIRSLCDGNNLEEIGKLGHAMMGLGMTFRLKLAEDSGRLIMEKVKRKDICGIRALAEQAIGEDLQ